VEYNSQTNGNTVRLFQTGITGPLRHTISQL